MSANIPNYTEKQLKQQLNPELVEGQQYYYSVINKRNNSGWGKNERLLIYHENKAQIYYTDVTRAPFKFAMRVPNRKQGKDVINIFSSLFIYAQGTNQLKIQFTKLQDNKPVQSEWILIMETNQLAKEWHTLITNRKNKKIGIDEKEKNNNLSFIHQTMNYAMLPQQKQKQPTSNINDSKGYQAINNTNSFIFNEQSGSNREDKKKQQIRKSEQENINKSSIIKNNQNANLNNSSIRNLNIPNNMSTSQIEGYNPNRSLINSRMSQINDQSRIRGSQIRNNQSIISNNTKMAESKINKQLQSDWNYKFYRDADQKTILEFKKYCEGVFKSIIINQDRSKYANSNMITFEKEGLIVKIAPVSTPQSSDLKMEFRNYHFILEATKKLLIVGIPLTTLIQFQGYVTLLKAPIPLRAKPCEFDYQTLNVIKDLQICTRIRNQILYQKGSKSCQAFDVTQIYGNDKNVRVVYLDNVISYLPFNTYEDKQISLNYTLRPELILDTVNTSIYGGKQFQQDKRTLTQVNKKIQLIVKNISNQLSNQQFLFSNVDELKILLHLNGINLKLLPLVYKQTTNRAVKKYIHSCMVAKVIKDLINQTLYETCKEPKRKKATNGIITDILRNYIEGGNTINVQHWKQLTFEFRKKYKISLNSHDIIPGFFINSLLTLLNVKYDIRKLDQSKKVFKQDGILGEGFVEELIPKVKTYWRYTKQINDKVNTLAREISQQNLQQIQRILKQKYQSRIPQYFSLNKTDQKIIQFFREFIPPSDIGTSKYTTNLPLYNTVNQQPPTAFSLNATKIYLRNTLMYNKLAEFKKTFQQSQKIVNYWFDENHPYHIELYDFLADYNLAIGQIEKSIIISRQSLIMATKSGTRTNKQLGQRYYKLATKQLKTGKKVDSMQSFIKAKNNMEIESQKSEYYALVLMNMSLLHLNNGDINKCIEYGVTAEKQFHENRAIDGRNYQKQHIKTYEILCRAYEINSMTTELKDIAIRCCQKFRKTKDQIVFQQMLRICMIGSIAKLNFQKAKILLYCLNKIKQSQPVQRGESIIYLSTIAQKQNFMPKFIVVMDTVDRIWSELSNKKGLQSPQSKQFLTLLVNISSVIGEEFISGIVQQKQYI